MEDSNKVVVFEKTELILILLFFLILIVTSFTLGIRLGKKLAIEESEFTAEDVRAVELKSVAEEEVEKALEDDQKLSDEQKLQKLMEESNKRLDSELDKFTQETDENDLRSDQSLPDLEEKGSRRSNSKTIGEYSSNEEENSSKAKSISESMVGKYTIQLGSYNTEKEALQFAEGFMVRGYSPILNEVHIEGKGTWFRVGLGVFETIEEAKDYIKKEKSLFADQDHVISIIQ